MKKTKLRNQILSETSDDTKESYRIQRNKCNAVLGGLNVTVMIKD